ncbi:lethal(2) giant larvae protein isoform X2 [Hermetia illucens]|nr:lethal(2) giant larvae protein isoform X2 [Hermetia illucens]XP_037913168.1 lethal(2) giant larvae protein isoform X2 [Hermetia illucens]
MKLLAIGTQSGALKIFGRPGVEFYGQHMSDNGSSTDCSVQLLEWVAGTGRILSLTIANQLILWEPHGTILDRIQTLSFEGKLKKVSTLCCSLSKDVVWIGTEGGNIYQFDLGSFTIKEPVIYHDVVLEQVPDTYRLNPGAIEAIKQLPNAWNNLLIAYNRGLCVLWDLESSSVLKTYISPGHGQSIGLFLNPSGLEFTWYHADGSYAVWKVAESNPPENQDYVPYGPDPCKSINCLVKGLRKDKEIVIFSGGMPRSTYGDHHCVSVHCGGSKICLDFTSRVIDFIVIFSDPDPQEVDVLLVLLEEELCAFDLTDLSLPPVKMPYLHSIHASAVTCNSLISGVTTEVYAKIVKSGDAQSTGFSRKEWPVTGGYLVGQQEEPSTYLILMTGHEDGSVKFWDCTGVVMKPIFHFKTANLFGHDEIIPPNDNIDSTDESEPPFRKAGQFDPYSDDPRLAIKKVALCPNSGQLAVAGTAGHIILASFEHFLQEGPLKVTTMNLVSDRDGFIWKGHDELKIRQNYLEENAGPVEESGIQINGVLQILPPATVTCLALQSDWNLIAAGTAHGLVLYDYSNHQPILSRCTLNPNDLTGAGEQLSRRKSFKKTLRESFRRLRKGRSTRSARNGTQKITEARPVERQVEARPIDDAMSSMVRCLVFAKTFITNVHTATPTLWVATNSSCVSIFILHMPKNQNNTESREMITAQLAKEIQMKHRAPVVSILIFDQAGSPVESQTTASGLHRVLIASEEQFKVFSLPHLKPITKYKLTAHEGARVRRVAFAEFSCHLSPEMQQLGLSKVANASTDMQSNVENHKEVGLLCLTNLGDCLVLSIPELKRQLNIAAVRREDINGISSFCFTNSGEALFMISSSELQRISLSKTNVTTPTGVVDLEPLPERIVGNNSSLHENDSVSSKQEEGDVHEDFKTQQEKNIENVTNGDASHGMANDTITSSVGDITVDSVKDHLNTTTTLCSTTTEETVGRLSILNTQTNNTLISANMKDVSDFNSTHLSDLSPVGKKTETNSSSVVIQSVITTISQAPGCDTIAKPVKHESQL